MREFCVYRHIRPDKDEVFYIGKGYVHTKRAYMSSRRNSHWHNIVNKNGGKFEVDIMLEGLTNEEAVLKEIEFIKLYGRKCDGGTLCNLSLGGGGTTGSKLSEEAKRKISQRAIGRKHSIESNEKNRASHLSRIWSEEHKQKVLM